MATVLEEPYPLKKKDGDVIIFPPNGLPVDDKDFDEKWASLTRYVLDNFPDTKANKLTTYNEQDITKRQQAARDAVSHLKKLARKELVAEIATQFKSHGIHTFTIVEDFEDTFKLMKTPQFDTDYTMHESTLKLIYEIVVATWKFRDDWKVKAIDAFCTQYNIAYEGDLEKQGSNGVKGSHCFLNIVNAAPVRFVRDKFEAAMDNIFGCRIKVHFGSDGKYGWGELDIPSDLPRSGRSADVAPVRYLSKNALMVKSSKAEEKKTKSKNDTKYNNTVTKLARVAFNLSYTPAKVSTDVQNKMNELMALPLPSVPPTQGTQLNHQLLPPTMAASATMGSNAHQLSLISAMAAPVAAPATALTAFQHPIQQYNAFGGMPLLSPPSPILGKQIQTAPAAPTLQSKQQLVDHQVKAAAALQVQPPAAPTLQSQQQLVDHQVKAAAALQVQQETARKQAEAAALQVQRDTAFREEEEKKRQQAEAATALQVQQEAARELEEEECQQIEPAKDKNQFLSEITLPAAEKAHESNGTDDDESKYSSDESIEPEVTAPKLGEVGYKVLKYFNDGWFVGEIIQPTEDVADGMFRVLYSDGDSEDFTKQQLKALRLAALRSSTIPSELRPLAMSTVTATKKKTVAKSSVTAKNKKKKAQAKATRSEATATPSVSSRRQATGNTLTNSTVSVIDTSKVELWSCDNAEKNTYNCVGTVCNPCKVKMVAEEEKKGKKSSRGKVEHGTKRNNDKLKRKAAAMLEEGDLLECKNDHSKSVTFCKEADKTYIVGPYADDVRKNEGCLPTKCCECGGRFV